MNARVNLIILFIGIFVVHCSAQFPSFREFDNIDEGGTLVNCFFQDDNGLVWVGTHEGLYIHTGNKLIRNDNNILNDKVIYCSINAGPDIFYIGTGNGLYSLNIKNNTTTFIDETISLDIRSLITVDENTLFLGTMTGLVKLDKKNKEIEKIEEIPSLPIYTLLSPDNKTIFISSYGGIFSYNIASSLFGFFPLPLKSGQSSLILSMGFDEQNNLIWLGTEGNLYRFDLTLNQFSIIPVFSGNSFKTIRIGNDGRIWFGTDNGLYIYDSKTKEQEYHVHSSRNDKSLINNIIWTIFEDREKNMWLGTDCGISLYRENTTYQIHRWEDITHSDEGNRITCIFKDSRDNYWFGGTNGLCRYNSEKNISAWYKMRGSPYTISHNRIRAIHEDRDGDLWVATDGSVNRFDYTLGIFTQYIIMDSTQTRNANWCYSIFDDDEGKLWVGAYLGGLFVVDKKMLLAHRGNVFLAEKNYHTQSAGNSLSSNRIQEMIPDKSGNIWISTSKEGLNRINPDKQQVDCFSQLQSEKRLSNNDITSLFCDQDGYIWVGMLGALNRIDPQTDEIIEVKDEILDGKAILSITEKDGYLWLTIADGQIAMHKETRKLKYVKIGDQRYACSFLDPDSETIWVGGIDQFIAFDPASMLMSNRKRPVVLTSLFVNDKLIQTGQEYDNKILLSTSFPYTRNIELDYQQNNLAIEFSNASYSLNIKSRYQYRLSPMEKDWRVLDDDSRRISYSNLHPGDYNLQIQQINDMDEEILDLKELHISILPPWYSRTWAQLIYAVLFIGLLIWVVNYFRVRNNLRIERIEKEKALELTEMKMDFLTSMSHELKTPLSLIISPVNKLLTSAKNTQNKYLLQTVHQNATRLSSLVHQIIDFSNTDIFKTDLFLSKLEIVEFTRSILQMFEEGCKVKDILLQLNTNVPQLYIEADILKMESVLNNLLSNALKFTPEGGRISVDLNFHPDDQGGNILQLIISDNGIGIPKDDLPFIFDRFFQSKINSGMNKDGSGIGLSMVKDYVELHKGRITVMSDEKEGTHFIITLPVVQYEDQKENEFIPMNEEVNDLKILIVEDNIEIARFIADNIKGSVCEIAHNGKLGLEQAQTMQPDVIISDIMMPVMDGIEMSRLLKQNISTATIPIILLTAKNDTRTESEAYGLGIDAFISKPFDISQLIIRIRQIVRSKSLLVSKLRQATIIEEKEMTVESQDEKFLKQITQIIEEKLGDTDLNVQKLADLSGFNAKQIYRRIKLLTGHTAVDYIKSIRLKKAAMLLSQQKFTIAEVMYMVGFSSHSYFSKCFSEKYGKTPRQYMESNNLK